MLLYLGLVIVYDVVGLLATCASARNYVFWG